jgi:ubiquinone/menaquinone biosynthesis C-methylase UbiE
VLLPHTLEFTDYPHQILREVARVLRPEGQVIIASFNPGASGVPGVFSAGGSATRGAVGSST